MTHVEFANDVIHLHNMEWQEFPPLSPNWKEKSLWFWSLDQHIPKLKFLQIQTLWSWFTIANMLKLLRLKSTGWTILQS